MTAPTLRPTEYPLLDLARHAVHGHKQIAEAVREHAERVELRREAAREALSTEVTSEQPAAPGG